MQMHISEQALRWMGGMGGIMLAVTIPYSHAESSCNFVFNGVYVLLRQTQRSRGYLASCPPTMQSARDWSTTSGFEICHLKAVAYANARRALYLTNSGINALYVYAIFMM